MSLLMLMERRLASSRRRGVCRRVVGWCACSWGQIVFEEFAPAAQTATRKNILPSREPFRRVFAHDGMTGSSFNPIHSMRSSSSEDQNDTAPPNRWIGCKFRPVSRKLGGAAFLLLLLVGSGGYLTVSEITRPQGKASPSGPAADWRGGLIGGCSIAWRNAPNQRGDTRGEWRNSFPQQSKPGRQPCPSGTTGPGRRRNSPGFRAATQ